jgi:hypothetical protein
MQLTLPAFGALIAAQGGHFAGIVRGHKNQDGSEQPAYAILVSPASNELQDFAWGQYGKEIAGCADRRNGKANTAAMLQAECAAAIAVHNLDVDGHKDWYLPSLGEMNIAAANVPELFAGDGIYWTSTQGSRYVAFVQDFASGNSYWYVKDLEFRVRAFRQIPLDLLTA